MNKNIIAIILAAVILIAVGGFLYSRNKPAGGLVTLPNSQAADAVVAYTDAGFSPKTVTVKVGDTVMFRNDSSGGMWVASAPHPVHTDYPEFDAKKSYVKGEAYSFTFEKSGTWKFHNHLKSTDFGSVTVE
ncbi:MAG: hypothetical protein A2288_00610 [Candidatus Moranbacteria bacterium RIFOXYA12_FULL_44_15]|nr:MAG: hypothetical protein A2288_00610 [Candidatus Moranbacteria bacterium RIFOXYA12_FULL_44_15]OGI36518.1 MAG: hypothetical protein A2259_02835 [Candidatus Moranbacteria bacterium RIFOXYA2_FULL_43_15]